MAVNDPYSPVPASTGPTRRQYPALTTSRSVSTSLNSPITTRSGRALGSVGGKTGPGFSPYARAAASSAREEEGDDGGDGEEDGDEMEVVGTPAREAAGLFGMVRGLPGRLLGSIFGSRGGGGRTLTSSQSVQDFHLADAEAQVEATGAPRGRGMPGGTGSRAGALREGRGLPRTTSLSVLSGAGRGAAPVQPPRQSLRTSHSTLVLPTASSNYGQSDSEYSNVPAHQRSPSPAHRRANSTTSSFGMPPSASSASFRPPSTPSFGQAATAPVPQQNNYGLVSRSPFASSARLASPLPSTPRSSSSSYTAGRGHMLYPYASSIPRGTSTVNGGPPPSPSAVKRSYPSASTQTLSQPRSPYNAPLSPPNSSRRPARAGSALRSFSIAPIASSVAVPRERRRELSDTEEEEERARKRKKEMVWDGSRGFVSKAVEGPQTSSAVPKNEAERLLQVLSGLRSTPAGVTPRPFQPQQIRVPTPATPSLPLSNSVFAPRLLQPQPNASTLLSPYTRRARPVEVDGTGRDARESREGTGLSSVFRAREERRRLQEAEAREDREARERERMREDELYEERRRQRDRERREEEEELERAPRRRQTRSMARDDGEPPVTKSSRAGTPAKKTKGKSAKGKGRSRKATSDDDDAATVVSSKSTRTTRPASPPPALPSPPRLPAALPTPLELPLVGVAASSSRPGRSHSSRKHVPSSKVFSAREEDLPPLDEGELEKIKLPPLVFKMGANGFGFGAGVGLSAAGTASGSLTATALALDKPATAPTLLSRLAVPSTLAAPPSTFSFAAPSPSLPPAISFAPTPAPASVVVTPAVPASSPAPADFFSKPSVAPLPPAPTATGSKPSFFSSALAERAPLPTPVADASPFSFGAPVAPVVVKKSEDKVELGKANPFAAFGAPIAQVVQAAASSSAAPLNGAPAFGGGMFGQSLSTPVEKSATPAFSFDKPATTSAPPPFSFGTAPSITASSTIKPVATTPFAGFGAVPSIEDPDEDSGMEDETPVVAAPPATAIPFSFGASPAPTSTSLFGQPAASSSSFGGFGAAKDTTSSGASLFGAAPAPSLFGTATASPFGGFGSATPSPGIAPAAGGFNFNSVASPPPTASPFNFGGSSTPAASSSTNFGGSTTPAAPQSSFSFGAPAPAASTSSNFFGAAPSSVAPSNSLFGNASSTPAFGSAAPPSLFGAASSNGSSSNAFAFGQPPAPSTPTGTGFSFGAASTPAAAAAPFNFGAPPASGFGTPTGDAGVFAFGAPPAAGATTPGAGAMFNVGSGGDESPGKGGRKIAALRRRRP